MNTKTENQAMPTDVKTNQIKKNDNKISQKEEAESIHKDFVKLFGLFAAIDERMKNVDPANYEETLRKTVEELDREINGDE